jgi:hypothetical protein
VEELAQIVARLAEATASGLGPDEPEPVPSWLDLPSSVREARELLDDLTPWLARVYLRYGDARGLPECWLWHPEIVEELLWLRRAWVDAYRVDGAPLARSADWHDRWRPGVVRRINHYAGNCSLDNHLHTRNNNRNGHRNNRGAPEAPHSGAAGQIATWWGRHRRDPAPGPTAEQLATSAAPPDGSRCRR